MQLRNKVTAFLRTQPYPAPFNTRSSADKSNSVRILHDVACFLSGNNPAELYNYLGSNSYIGKSHFPNNDKAKKVLENIRVMHINATNRYKSSILSLVSNSYSRNELTKIGFQFSNDQFCNANKKVCKGNFSLEDYRRHIPQSRRSINQETIDIIVKYLEKNSRISSMPSQINR